MTDQVQPGARRRYDLSGAWNAAIDGHPVRTVKVPSSYPPVGTMTLSRSVSVERKAGRRVFLIFEGVAHDGEVRVGDRLIGRLVALSHHEFDVTDVLAMTGDDVTLSVTLTDLNAQFGNSPGWETYGGIVRPIYLEERNANYLAEPQIDITLSPSSAKIMARIGLVRTDPGQVGPLVATLRDDQGIVVATEMCPLPGVFDYTTASCTLEVSSPRLWSPDSPYLYQLEWLWTSEGEADRIVHSVGIREIRVQGRQFYLNRQRIFLKGVCRHDLWADQGYTLTPEQIRHDLLEIKAMGANFVRLVHYPHDPHVVDIADQVGLLVSEEPGFWNVRLTDEHLTQAKEAALDVLTRLILRDRTHPSVLAWLLGNESWSDGAYLQKASSLCRTLDGTRPVGFSDLYATRLGKKVASREAYAGWEPDFYDYHPYGEAADLYREPPRYLNDKPLIYGEWGGFWVQHDDWLMERIGRQFAEWAAAPEDAPFQVAGFAFWEWADMRQYQRGYPGCEAGVLTEGLVTESRQRKPEWERMRRVIQAIEGGYRRKVVPYFDCVGGWSPPEVVPVAVAVSGDVAARQVSAWQTYAPGYEEWTRLPESLEGSALAVIQSPTRHPLLLSPVSSHVEIIVARQVTRLILIGLGDLAEGYPVMHRFGDVAARLSALKQNGEREVRLLRHGLEVARQNRLFQGSRIEPLALETVPVFDWVADPDWDVRIVRALTWELQEPAWIERVILELVDGQSALVFHAVSAG